METKNMLFVYNPWAGRREISRELHHIIDTFTQNGFIVTVHPTQADNDAYCEVLKNGSKYDYVVCSGGDGTLNETIHALMELEEDVPVLGYIPTGSTNDFANSIGLPVDVDDALEVLCDRKTKFIDVGEIEGRYFAYVCAFGLFTDVSYDTSQNMKNVFGHTAYILEGVRRLTNIVSYDCKITMGDKTVQDKFIFGMITNSASVGGFRLPTKEENQQDSDFYLILLNEIRRLADVPGVISILLGIRNPDEQFTIVPVNDKLTIESKKPLAWTVDGEFGGAYNESNIKIYNQAIEMILP